MIYVLIIASSVYHGYTISQHDFDNKAACERAAELVQKEWKARAVCVPRS